MFATRNNNSISSILSCWEALELRRSVSTGRKRFLGMNTEGVEGDIPSIPYFVKREQGRIRDSCLSHVLQCFRAKRRWGASWLWYVQHLENLANCSDGIKRKYFKKAGNCRSGDNKMYLAGEESEGKGSISGVVRLLNLQERVQELGAEQQLSGTDGGEMQTWSSNRC